MLVILLWYQEVGGDDGGVTGEKAVITAPGNIFETTRCLRLIFTRPANTTSRVFGVKIFLIVSWNLFSL